MYNEEKIYELTDEWESLNIQLWNECFDYENFKNTARDTFEILFEHRDDDTVSKDLMGLVLKINVFAENAIPGATEEAAAAKLIAEDLCDQFLLGWIETDNGIDKRVFVVTAENGADCFIDTETFDLSELIENGFEIE